MADSTLLYYNLSVTCTRFSHWLILLKPVFYQVLRGFPQLKLNITIVWHSVSLPFIQVVKSIDMGGSERRVKEKMSCTVDLQFWGYKSL